MNSDFTYNTLLAKSRQANGGKDINDAHKADLMKCADEITRLEKLHTEEIQSIQKEWDDYRDLKENERVLKEAEWFRQERFGKKDDENKSWARPSNYGAKNKYVTREDFKKAEDSLRAKLQAGIPLYESPRETSIFIRLKRFLTRHKG